MSTLVTLDVDYNMEIYNIRDLKILVAPIVYTPAGSKGRLHNKFIDSNCLDSKFLFLIYSGRTKYIEVGFNNQSVYKVLRVIFKQDSVNNLIMKVIDYIEANRQSAT